MMKHLTTRLGAFWALVMLTTASAWAQLPDGSIAPDWTATDINGVEHNLQSYLDSGKTVIITFHATWCGPCWAYHNTHILWDMYETFGPNGTNDLMVLYLEADDTTTQADLEGTGTATTGDWITGTPYPIIDNAGGIFDSYAGAYYPTIYTICPDGTLVESGQSSFDAHVQMAFADCGAAVSGAAPLCSYNGETAACGGSVWTASTEMFNQGTDTIYYALFEVTLNGNTSYVEWTGSLPTGSAETVNLGEFTSAGDLTVHLIGVNAEPWSATETVNIIGSTESTTIVQVRITTDNWPEETSWEIRNDEGAIVASIAGGSLAGMADTEFVWDVELPALGCYEFTLFDAYGDGLHGSQWGSYSDGTATVTSMSSGSPVAVLFDYDGATGEEFTEIRAGIEAVVVSAFEGCTDPSACNYWPQATEDDGSCDYSCLGCTDPVAWNYNAEATVDDGSCFYFQTTCTFIGSEAWLNMETNLYAGPDTLVHEFGVSGSGELVINLPTVMAEPTTGSLFGVMSWNNLTWSGWPNGLDVGESPVSMAAGTQACVSYEGIPYEEGEFEVKVTGDLVLSVFGQPYPVGDFSGTYPMKITPNVQGILGCTYANATNYLMFATVDDGSCSYEGCMDPEANNYQVYAMTDDGSCVFEPCASACPGDLDNDGAIGTGDLLGLLGTFGMTCE